MEDQPISPKLIITKELSIARVLVVMIMVFAVGAGVIGTLTLRDVRSKAANTPPSPTPFVEVAVPSPKTALKAPFVRLVSSKDSYTFNTAVPLDLYLSTAATSAAELDVFLTYNPDYLTISKEDIKKEDVFKTIDIDLSEEGTISLSLFVNAQVGHPPVILDTEKKVASLNFKTKSLATDSAQMVIDFRKGNVKKTSLAKYSQTREDKPTNLLQSVESANFAIK